MQQHARRSGGSHRPTLRLLLPLLAAAVACAGCAGRGTGRQQADARQFTHDVPAFGTHFKVVFYAPDAAAAAAASGAVAARLADLQAKLAPDSADSELSRLAAGAGGATRKVSDDLFNVL